MRTLWRLVRRSAVKWNDDDCLTLGAALAYYTVFSLAPVLVVVIAVAGALFGRDAAQGEIVGEIRSLVGDEGARAIQALIQSASRQGTGRWAALFGFVVLLFGSTSAFSQLQWALNRIWEVRAQAHSGFWELVRARMLSFTAVLGAGFLLSVSLVLSAAVVAFGRYGSGWVPGIGSMLEAADFFGSMIVHTLLFAMIFKLLPDVSVRWRDVWVGAAVTAALFFVGKAAIGLYIGTTALGSAYGAAGWIILVLAWVYYSSQIVLFGAEFTRVYASHAWGAVLQTPSSRNGDDPLGRGLPFRGKVRDEGLKGRRAS